LKIKFEIEIDTDNIEDQEKLEKIIEALNNINEKLKEL
jgi:hypothetical protein